VGFYLLNILPPTCASLTTAAGTFGFTASDTVINNCTIAATGLSFQTGASGLLNQDLTTQGSLTVQCTNNDAYKITLSPGASTVQTARTMVGTAGGATVNYQLYTDSARSLIWGDGTGGTVASTGTGTGNSQTIIIYGKVPAQSPTPRPTTYTDTITATIYF
jgi:spore coat protein U-like protein